MHWFKNFKKKSPPGVLLSSKHRASSSYTSITKLQSEQHLPFFKDGTTICCSGLPWIDCSSGWMLDLWTSCPNLHSSWGYSLVPQRPIFLLTILSSSFSSPPPQFWFLSRLQPFLRLSHLVFSLLLHTQMSAIHPSKLTLPCFCEIHLISPLALMSHFVPCSRLS